jgi:hypothetical protein
VILVEEGRESPVVTAVSKALHDLVDAGHNPSAVMLAAMGIAGVWAAGDAEHVDVYVKQFRDGVGLGLAHNTPAPQREVARG